MTFQAIETDRLALTKPAVTDDYAFELYRAIIESHSELVKWLPWAKVPPTEEGSRQFIAAAHARWYENHPESLPLIVEHRFDKRILGCIGAVRCNWEVPAFELGYWIRSTEIGHGYGVEAVKAFSKYLLDERKARRVEIRMDSLNRHSLRVAKDAGFALEATLKNHRLSQSSHQVSDTLILSICR